MEQCDLQRIEAQRDTQMIADRACAARPCEPLAHPLRGLAWQQVEMHDCLPFGLDPVADQRARRIDQAAFDAGVGQHEFALLGE